MACLIRHGLQGATVLACMASMPSDLDISTCSSSRMQWLKPYNACKGSLRYTNWRWQLVFPFNPTTLASCCKERTVLLMLKIKKRRCFLLRCSHVTRHRKSLWNHLDLETSQLHSFKFNILFTANIRSLGWIHERPTRLIVYSASVSTALEGNLWRCLW